MYEVWWSDVNTGYACRVPPAVFTTQSKAITCAETMHGTDPNLTFTVVQPQEDGYRKIIATFYQKDYFVDREVGFIEQP